MKYLIIDGPVLRATYSDLLDQMYVMRARVFKERLQWKVQVDAQGHERDQFDDWAVYLLIVDDDGLKASMRMLPSTGPSLHDKLFPNVAAPMSPEIWEASRICFAPDLKDRFAVQSTMALALDEFAKKADMSSLVAHVDSVVLRYMRTIGFDIDVLGKNEYANLVMMSTGAVARHWG